MKTAVAFVGSQFNFNFFARLYDGLHSIGYHLILLACKPSLWFHARLLGIPCLLVRKNTNVEYDNQIHSTIELLLAQVNEQQALQFWGGIIKKLETLRTQNNIELFLIWNGNSIPTKAMSVFAQKHDIPVLYFELSNIPGKIFCDPRGVNAQSLLFQKPEVLDCYSIDEQLYGHWKKTYTAYKRVEQITPFAVHSKRSINIFFPIDSIVVKLFNLPAVGEMNITGKIKAIIKLHSIPTFIFDKYDLTSGKYNFFPMQLHNDSQLVYNSPITLQDAIATTYEQTRAQKRDLLVKPHPIEKDKNIIEYLVSLKGKKNLYIVNEPTFSIVEHCQELITINSTVGLEGLIAGKKITFLGTSYYANMNNERLKKYLLGYLIDIDCLSKEKISRKLVETMLARLQLQ